MGPINQSDDETAFVAMLTGNQNAIVLTVRALMPGERSIDEVVQQTNAKLWQKRGDFKHGTNFRAWAAAVARYEVLNYRKQQARDARLTFSDELEYQIASEVGELHDDLLDRHAALRECLQELKAESRELLLSRYSSDETLAELASRVGRSVGGIKVTLCRLRTALAHCIDRRLQLDILLEREAASVLPAASDAAILQPNRDRFRWVKILSGTLVAIAASVLVMIDVNQTITPPDRAGTVAALAESQEPSANGFAVLSGLENAVWSGPSIAAGDLMPTGELHLKSGRIHIELFSGVQMVVEGDSVFSIDSPMQVTMASGSARARVPEPAQGFRIKTASGDVVDLGTEFSVDVDESGADVHVVDGEVELQPHDSDALRIDAGVSRRLARSGGIIDSASTAAVAIGSRTGRGLNRRFLLIHVRLLSTRWIPIACNLARLKIWPAAQTSPLRTERSLSHREPRTAGGVTTRRWISVASAVACV